MLSTRIALGGALAAMIASATAVRADNAATGVWIDHTGRGAVEITECNGNLCGHVAWVKDEQNKDQCGKQIIGNVKSVGTNKWDNGWIYDPDRDAKYDVAISLIGDDKLKVTGYAGTKWLSETYTWKRAPADLPKCGASDAKAPATKQKGSANVDSPADAAKPAPQADTTPAAPPAEPKADTAKSDAAPSDTTKSDTAKSEPPADKSDTAPVDLPKADADSAGSKSTAANPDESKPQPPAADAQPDEPKKDTAKKDKPKKDGASEEDTADNDQVGEDAGKIVSRIIESLDEGGEEGDGSPKKKKGTCKFNVPYADIVVSVPCDK